MFERQTFPTIKKGGDRGMLYRLDKNIKKEARPYMNVLRSCSTKLQHRVEKKASSSRPRIRGRGELNPTEEGASGDRGGGGSRDSKRAYRFK